MPKYLDRREQSDWLRDRGLKYSHNTLNKLATIGGGPKYVVIGGRALSTEEWLAEWVASKTSAPRTCTSEAA